MDWQNHPMKSFTAKRLLYIAFFLLSSLLFYTLSSSSSSTSTTTTTTTTALSVIDESNCNQSFGLMIDAGSTGSRLHLYKFLNCKNQPLPKLHSESFYSTKPGLSYYAKKPKEAAESLKEMMNQALQEVPLAQQGCTKLELKATAGLRLLGQKDSDEILEEVENWLKREYPFKLGKDAVGIMEGKDEGTSTITF